MRENGSLHFPWPWSARYGRSLVLVMVLAAAAFASLVTPASACRVRCQSYEAEVAASDLVFQGQVESVRVVEGLSIATIRPLRWIKGFTRLPIIATAPIQQTRLEREFDCPGPIRVTIGLVTVFGAMRAPDGVSFNVRTDYCVNMALNTPGNRNNANAERPSGSPPLPQVSQWTPHGLPVRPGRPGVAGPDIGIARYPWAGLGNMTFSSASCMKQGGVGHASCAAVCPAEHLVLHCSHSVGNLSGGDTCTSLGRISSVAAVANGQPQPQPHDRCVVSAACTDQRSTLSVQAWATCYKSNRSAKSASCDTLNTARSPKNALGLTIAMRNMSSQPRTLNWIDFEGIAIQIRVLAPGEEYPVRTAPGHVWAFLNQGGECKDVFVAGVGENRFDLEK